MKKLIIAALAATTIAASTFAEVSFHFGDSEKSGQLYFSNKLASDIVHYFKPKNSSWGDSHTNFAGITNEVIAEYLGNKLSVGVKAKADFYKSNPWDDDSVYKIEWKDFDYYAEFAASNMIGVGYHDVLWTRGSYLPVADTHALGGDYGTDGIVALIRPSKELTFGAGVDFGDVHGNAYWFGDGDRNQDYAVAVGIDYSTKQFAFGGSIHHLISDLDNLLLGAYGSIKADSLTLNFGFTHAENGNVGLTQLDFIGSGYYYENNSTLVSANAITNYGAFQGIYGENVITAGLLYDAKKLGFGADIAFSIDNEDDWGYYDLYGAVDFNFAVDSTIGFDVKGFILMDFGDDIAGTNGLRSLDSTIGLYPKLTLAMNKNHSFALGLIAQFGTDSDYGYTACALPVSWKYVY